MNTYNQYKREVGKDAIKSVAFFFVGVPAFIVLVALTGVKGIIVAALAGAGILWLIKKARAAKSA